MQRDQANYTVEAIKQSKKFDGYYPGNLCDYYNYCLRHVSISGLWLEFGVYVGDSIKVLAQYAPKIYGFDSFEGLPEDWQKTENEIYTKGKFSISSRNVITALERYDNIELIIGWFNESIPIFLQTHEESCALIHIDCDLYSSTKTVLTLLDTRIINGTVILFDELIGYTNFRDHEMKAWLESEIECDYIAYATTQVALVVKNRK